MKKMGEKFSRPGRKIAAERRRIARQVIREFYGTPEFEGLPQKIRLALLELCPVKDTHPVK